MRIWSLHPENLDVKGLVALWRETLLAKNVLEEKTKGYKNHPQLYRFKRTVNPVACINQYLTVVYEEATKRGYNFDKTKVDFSFKPTQLEVTNGQIDYEKAHLLKKLKVRDIKKYKMLSTAQQPITAHPLFKVIPGSIADWEVT